MMSKKPMLQSGIGPIVLEALVKLKTHPPKEGIESYLKLKTKPRLWLTA